MKKNHIKVLKPISQHGAHTIPFASYALIKAAFDLVSHGIIVPIKSNGAGRWVYFKMPSTTELIEKNLDHRWNRCLGLGYEFKGWRDTVLKLLFHTREYNISEIEEITLKQMHVRNARAYEAVMMLLRARK